VPRPEFLRDAAALTQVQAAPVAEAIAAPGTPSAKSVAGKKRERRKELAGLEPGDPLSTYHLLMRGINNVRGILPKLLIKYWWVALVVIGVWTFLGWFDAIRLAMKYPQMAGLFMGFEKLILFIVFITAAYNNFVAKAVYATIMIRVGLPLIRQIKSEGMTKVLNDFKKVIPDFKANWAETGPVGISILVSMVGSALIISNFLTRNNVIDKIAVSLALAMALLKALNVGSKSLPFMTGRVVSKDISMMFLKPSPVRHYHLYVAISALAVGFFGALPLSFMRITQSYYDPTGYILGGIAIVAAVPLYFVTRGKNIKSEL
jgi:hypothetical protein